MLLEIEVQGVRQVLASMPKDEVVTVYVDAGSWEDLEQRIRARAPITDDELEKRRKRFDDELTFKPEATYIVRNGNGELEQAKKHFLEIISMVHDENKVL